MQNDEIGKIQLEDLHEDIIGKAMRGLGTGKNEMASRLKCEKSEVEAILSGRVDESLIFGMAKELNLDTEKLLRSARKEWSPAPLTINGLKQFNLPFGEMLVNVFVAWDDHTKCAWVFDTGPLADPILSFIQEPAKTSISIKAYCLPLLLPVCVSDGRLDGSACSGHSASGHPNQ